MNAAQDLAQQAMEPSSFVFNVGGLTFNPSYVQAGAIVFLLFLMVLTLARLRKLYVGWSLGKGSIAMIAWGFILTVILEGFFLLSGRTILTEILGWENAPKPIQVALDSGRNKLVNVLGVTDEVPSSMANETPTFQSVVTDYQTLPAEDSSKARALICQ